MREKPKLTETEAVHREDVFCNECNTQIHFCDKCKDHFMAGDIIFCSIENHYCSECVDEHKEEIENDTTN